MRKTMLALSPLLLLACMGSTDCDAYSTVTVPLVDGTNPDTYDGVWDPDTSAYEELISQSGTFTYHLTLGHPVIAVASGLDQGGMRKVVMRPEISWTCCSGNVCSTTQSIMASITATQACSVGSQVSLDAPPHCQSGYTLKGWTYRWTTVATDCHNRTRTSPSRSIVYP